MAKVLTKSQIIQTIAEAHKDKLARKDVARLLESLTTVGHKELKKNGIFVLPGFAKFVVVKNMMNFRFGYRDVMKAYYVLDIPGPTTQDMRTLPFERITRPVFPLDRDFEPAIAVSVRAA